MMYQFIAISSLRLEKLEHPLHHAADSEIHQEQKHAEKEDRGDHHSGGRTHIVETRPGDLAGFYPHLVQEALRAPRIFQRRLPSPLHRARDGYGYPRTAGLTFVLQLERLCQFLLPLSSPPAKVAPNLAGEEGFEPPHPVLETGGLPLNLLP